MLTLCVCVYCLSSGYYMYTEASDGLQEEVADLITHPPTSATTTRYCFRFWYHMYGEHMGKLEILYFLNTDDFNILWYRKG